MTQYRVIAPLVIAPDADGKLHYHYAGAEVETIEADAAKRLVGEGLIEKVRATGRSAAAATTAKTQASGKSEPKKSGDSTPPSGDGPPPLVAPDEDWQAYAVTQGLTEDEAKALSKADLVARFSQ
ncbi:hypothetical protein SEA_BUNKER_7 [Gordonia phage Bunker]|nr:hypothetical protein SEA_BUNKER_7 [Gordonia phage Bunker]